MTNTRSLSLRTFLTATVVLALVGCAKGATTDRCEGIACPRTDASVDGGSRDGGATDDADVLDAGPIPSDAEPLDGGALDSGTVDAGPLDAGGPCGEAPCDLWMLPRGESSWSGYARARGGLAPTSPIVAAFDVESLGRAWILTASTYHVMRMIDRAWIAAGPREDLFPQMRGATILTALSVPDPNPPRDHEIVLISSANTVYTYNLYYADGRVEYAATTTEFGPEWSEANAPVRSQIRFDFFDDLNERGWADGDLRSVCPGATSTRISSYATYVTSTTAHQQELPNCFRFFRRATATAFEPFRLPGAPPLESVTAAFQHQGTIFLLAE